MERRAAGARPLVASGNPELRGLLLAGDVARDADAARSEQGTSFCAAVWLASAVLLVLATLVSVDAALLCGNCPCAWLRAWQQVRRSGRPNNNAGTRTPPPQPAAGNDTPAGHATIKSWAR